MLLRHRQARTSPGDSWHRDCVRASALSRGPSRNRHQLAGGSADAGGSRPRGTRNKASYPLRNRRSGAVLPPANDRGVDQIPDLLRDIAGGTPLPLVVIGSRSEFGAQIDMLTVLGGVPVSGFVKAAWAHCFERDASLTANLAALPGASFTTAGAKPDRDGAILALASMPSSASVYRWELV